MDKASLFEFTRTFLLHRLKILFGDTPVRMFDDEQRAASNEDAPGFLYSARLILPFVK